ncbi:Rv3235 family protein [Streptomyces albicerus]|uniref:Rv3235 family protein n=1 Tax=Streptomyces albicerus TaxID=2569859 RepID=UPI00124B8A35|nr:Rv3235 family protein [Streptomyces albicerus]
MNKVMTRMTRTKHTPGTRPPVRHDTRRPGSGTPRTAPGGGRPRTTTRGGRPPTGPTAVPTTAPTTGGGPDRRASGSGSSRTLSGAGARSAAPGDSPQPTTSAAAPPRTARTALAEGLPTAPPQPRPTDLFADRLLAVLSGQRPVHCMLRHTAGRAYDELAWLAERGPLRARGTRPVVRDIGYYVPRPGAVEAFARIGAGDQLRAMAFRLEQGPDLRWRCTAVELGGARMPHTDDD